MVQAGYILASADGSCVHAPVAVLRIKTSLLGTLLTRPPKTTILDPSSPKLFVRGEDNELDEVILGLSIWMKEEGGLTYCHAMICPH